MPVVGLLGAVLAIAVGGWRGQDVDRLLAELDARPAG